MNIRRTIAALLVLVAGLSFSTDVVGPDTSLSQYQVAVYPGGGLGA